MQPPSNQDPIGREVRALILAKYLLRLEVRTDMITRFTAIPRSRLGAIRRRLAVPKETRHRGPGPWRAEGFISGPDRRRETCALAALLVLYDLISPDGSSAASPPDRLAAGERLCGVYQCVHELCPEIEIDFEGLVLLRTTLARRQILETSYCRSCGCLIVVERNDLRHRRCELCEEAAVNPGTDNGRRFSRLSTPNA